MTHLRFSALALTLGILGFAVTNAEGQCPQNCVPSGYLPAQVRFSPSFTPIYPTISPSYSFPSAAPVMSSYYPAVPGCMNGMCRPGSSQVGAFPTNPYPTYGSAPGSFGFQPPVQGGMPAVIQPPRSGLGGGIREGSGSR